MDARSGTRAADQITRVLAGEQPEGLELTRRVTATYRTLVARVAPVVAPAAARVVLHDITDLRRADQIRRDFVANVCMSCARRHRHKGYTEALIDETDGARDAQFLDIITSACGAHGTAGQGSAAARASRRRQELAEPSPAIPRVIAKPARRLRGGGAGKKSSSAAQCRGRCQPDRRRSREAARHRPQPRRERDQLHARMGRHRHHRGDRRRQYRLRVADTGPGFRPRSRPRLRALHSVDKAAPAPAAPVSVWQSSAIWCK